MKNKTLDYGQILCGDCSNCVENCTCRNWFQKLFGVWQKKLISDSVFRSMFYCQQISRSKVRVELN